MGMNSRSPSVMRPGGIVKARKDHTCTRCGAAILRGALYYQPQSLPFGAVFRNCLGCAPRAFVDPSLAPNPED